jgi:hypothetical protein
LLTYSEHSAELPDQETPTVLRSISIAVVSGALLVTGALPAAAAGDVRTAGDPHTFSVPGVYGIGAWGSYEHIGAEMRITICVEDTTRGVYGGAAAAVAYGSGRRHQTIAAVTVGYRHISCQAMITSYTNHLIVDALSGWRDGKVRQVGHTRQIY